MIAAPWQADCQSDQQHRRPFLASRRSFISLSSNQMTSWQKAKPVWMPCVVAHGLEYSFGNVFPRNDGGLLVGSFHHLEKRVWLSWVDRGSQNLCGNENKNFFPRLIVIGWFFGVVTQTRCIIFSCSHCWTISPENENEKKTFSEIFLSVKILCIQIRMFFQFSFSWRCQKFSRKQKNDWILMGHSVSSIHHLKNSIFSCSHLRTNFVFTCNKAVHNGLDEKFLFVFICSHTLFWCFVTVVQLKWNVIAGCIDCNNCICFARSETPKDATEFWWQRMPSGDSNVNQEMKMAQCCLGAIPMCDDLNPMVPSCPLKNCPERQKFLCRRLATPVEQFGFDKHPQNQHRFEWLTACCDNESTSHSVCVMVNLWMPNCLCSHQMQCFFSLKHEKFDSVQSQCQPNPTPMVSQIFTKAFVSLAILIGTKFIHLFSDDTQIHICNKMQCTVQCITLWLSVLWKSNPFVWTHDNNHCLNFWFLLSQFKFMFQWLAFENIKSILQFLFNICFTGSFFDKNASVFSHSALHFSSFFSFLCTNFLTFHSSSHNTSQQMFGISDSLWHFSPHFSMFDATASDPNHVAWWGHNDTQTLSSVIFSHFVFCLVLWHEAECTNPSGIWNCSVNMLKIIETWAQLQFWNCAIPWVFLQFVKIHKASFDF